MLVWQIKFETKWKCIESFQKEKKEEEEVADDDDDQWIALALFQGQPWLSAHCNTSKWPPRAAQAHVCSSQGQPSLRAHCNTSK